MGRVPRDRPPIRRARLTRALAALALVGVLGAAAPARADESIAPEADFRHLRDWGWFLLGATSGFVAHELGHVMTDVFYNKKISFVETHLGPIPFFAIQPCCNLTRMQEYVIASAGFWVQDINSELIFHLAPRLRARRLAYLKGVLALDVGLSVGYAITGFLHTGPDQSDINTMARGLNVPPWEVGLVLIVPEIVDVYRYFVPGSKWAPYASMSTKLLMFGAGFTF